MLVPGRRDGHQHAGRLFADIGDVVLHARRNEQEGAGGRADHLSADVPDTFAVKHIEGFFLHAMHMQAGGEAGRYGPVEHARVSGIPAGDEEHHRLATQHYPLVLVGHADDRGGAHLILHRFAAFPAATGAECLYPAGQS